MILSITSPAAGAVIASNATTVTVQGTSVQKVNGVAQPAQSFSVDVDVSKYPPGPVTLSLLNSSGDNATVSIKKQTSESADGTTVTDGTSQIVDANGDVWTLASGVTMKNGSPSSTHTGITKLLYQNHIVNEFDGTNWWYYVGDPWRPIADPRPVPTVGFYGINGHVGWGAPYTNLAAQISAMLDLGMKTYRTGYDPGNGPGIRAFIQNYAQPAGIGVYAVALPPQGAHAFNNNVAPASEADGYNEGFRLGQDMANYLSGLVKAYEVGNELCSYALRTDGSFNGDVPSHYDNTRFTIARGMIRGVIEGIRSIDKTTPFVGPACLWLHYGFTNMLRNGTQPDGTSGHPLVDWDITAWHWYSDMGNMESAGNISANVLNIIKGYGKPIWLTEYGVRQSLSGVESDRTNYLTGATCMADWVRVKNTYNIQHTCMYELYDDGKSGDEGAFGLVLNDGVTPKPTRYAAVKAFIAANPL